MRFSIEGHRGRARTGAHKRASACRIERSGCSSVAIGHLRSSPPDHPFSLVCYCMSVFLRAAFRSVGLRACMSEWGAVQYAIAPGPPRPASVNCQLGLQPIAPHPRRIRDQPKLMAL
ncbi:hypothetical protein EVAR_50401_1 [Eumeta japonica]|uniref:Uncharacterized protein n=1 Tax=Eumeta variegata TaxID=151549 RepID=A0A4C1WXW7_EUMVA|nr:hypothetical protein EVAR_50401_1 [Eumeta japonica]